MKLLTAFIQQNAPADSTLMQKVQQTVQDDGNWIMHHIADKPVLVLPPIHIGGFTLDMSISMKILMLIIAAVLMVILFGYAAASNKKRKHPTGLGNFLEMLMVFVRDDVVKPSMGHGADKYLPFFFTMFFFILFVNVISLFPGMSTGTSSISVTAGLALITFIMTQIHGIKHNGFVGYFKGLIPPGVPVFVLPIMVIIEFLGLLTKPFALAIRLFANMTAGHIVIYALIGLIFMLGYAVIPVSIAFTLFIYVLEILVAVLQAYIFTMLSALFIGMAIHQDH
ncbi:MAG TPA: F0F1 ATP synthase subunit A [Ignavibacteria bacterium]|nr:F0F1 ATP synthase subunit A [Ignavibacteria bacterium]HRF64986.1 F0F1 ATP synthase subunit A [Ignavibacteria bacterium]HRJ03413.1 F0F1 ATP synthase subunit A [Ignavibacteria bacterium]HRJ85528.1 F0F1 ATP synthase subunit A [Ignavibacteria bacterium]